MAAAAVVAQPALMELAPMAAMAALAPTWEEGEEGEEVTAALLQVAQMLALTLMVALEDKAPLVQDLDLVAYRERRPVKQEH